MHGFVRWPTLRATSSAIAARTCRMDRSRRGIRGDEGDAALHQAADAWTLRHAGRALAMTSVALRRRQAGSGSASRGRIAALPRSTSVNPATSFPLPPLRRPLAPCLSVETRDQIVGVR